MKKILSISLVLSLFLAFSGSVGAKNSKNYAPDQEQAVENGVYDVKGRPDMPDMKVKVFVHKEKGKPGSSAAALACPLADPGSEAVVGDAGWRLPSTTPVVYRLNPSSVPSSVGGGNLTTIVNNSFGPWKEALASASPNITPGLTTSANRARFDGQNIIAWGRTSGSTLGVTYVWYYTISKQVAEVDTIMNSRVPWSWSNGNSTCPVNAATYDAQNIMIHELGHWFGLDDEYTSDYVNNTMYGYGKKGEVKKDTLTNGDAVGVNNLY